MRESKAHIKSIQSIFFFVKVILFIFKYLVTVTFSLSQNIYKNNHLEILDWFSLIFHINF